MKLRNKQSGEIKEFVLFDGNELQGGATLESLTKEWEDYEEPKDFWYIEPNGVIARIDEWDCCTDSDIGIMKTLGNHFETKEEAEKAVEKLKAWKRLKDKGYKFGGWYFECAKQEWVIKLKTETYEEFVIGQTKQDLDLLFGGCYQGDNRE